MAKFTNEQKRLCAERELKMRQRVYPRWVESNRMTKQKADEELAIMAEIVADYDALGKDDLLI